MRDKNFLKDFGASLRDFFGGRTDSYEKAMLEGRETAQREMRERAEKLGANAIVFLKNHARFKEDITSAVNTSERMLELK